MTTREAKLLLDTVFEEGALTLGGLAAAFDLDDEVVWRLIEDLDGIRTRALRRLRDEGVEEARERPDARPHPAIEQFLHRLHQEALHA